LRAFDKSTGKLGLDQIDLLTLHQPRPTRFDLIIEAYRVLQTLLQDDKVRAIGSATLRPVRRNAPAVLRSRPCHWV
jgi:diketogulonate reductase-like aldo/keto reductase